MNLNRLALKNTQTRSKPVVGKHALDKAWPQNNACVSTNDECSNDSEKQRQEVTFPRAMALAPCCAHQKPTCYIIRVRARETAMTTYGYGASSPGSGLARPVARDLVVVLSRNASKVLRTKQSSIIFTKSIHFIFKFAFRLIRYVKQERAARDSQT